MSQPAKRSDGSSDPAEKAICQRRGSRDSVVSV
jgi:hypothetical protein